MENIQEVKVVRRGYYKDDEKWFLEDNIKILKKAQEELYWLLNRGYNSEPTTNFIGGRYQLSARQRDALKRTTSTKEECENRISKMLDIHKVRGSEVLIDGFNLIITLEVALSKSTLIKANDETIRDLAGLRGTYKLIDKTYDALNIIGAVFNELGIKKALFYLDAPVSNSGRLKQTIISLAEEWNTEIEVELVPDADKLLWNKENVITTDSIILDKCISWINLSRYIIEKRIKDSNVIELV